MEGALLSRLAIAVLALLSPTALAHDGPQTHIFSSGFNFAETTGEELFANICQGCHMPDGSGASGAGTYPSLVADRNLEARGYPVYLVINGRKAMPPFGEMMTDAQIAAVVNYLRTHFDNNYQDIVTAGEVRDARR
ncbi:c-type cytochrome [Bradyrhizobium guangdongense]|uniref:c-type cytochrome n=1 Tax=Bradyrhizobium guangdongense TaxID=1325090 RepID=UPI001FEE0B1A|nr:cytochrome c [Bradyrhizobium guangdongense]